MIKENDLDWIKEQLGPNARYWRHIDRAKGTKGPRVTLEASGMKWLAWCPSMK